MPTFLAAIDTAHCTADVRTFGTAFVSALFAAVMSTIDASERAAYQPADGTTFVATYMPADHAADRPALSAAVAATNHATECAADG